MLRNLIRSLITRSLITISINLHRGQLLKGNRSINRLLSILNSDINLGGTTTTLSSSELSLTSTQLSLAILGHQRRIQVVLLTRHQTLIGHSVSNNRIIDNTNRTLSKLSLSLNRRRLSGRVRAASTVLIRQTWLIHGHDRLNPVIRNAAGMYYGNIRISRLLRNLHRVVFHKLQRIPHAPVNFTLDLKTREFCKLLFRSGKRREKLYPLAGVVTDDVFIFFIIPNRTDSRNLCCGLRVEKR